MKKEVPKSSAKDTFIYLLGFAMLYTAVINFVSLWFSYTNELFPDQLDYYYSQLNDIRFSTSVLIVVWPVYILMSWLSGSRIRKNPEQKKIAIRKWLTYLTLFIAAVTIVIDLVTLIHNFLGGELTTPFLIKVLITLLVAAAVFGFYLWDDHHNPKQQSKKPKLYAWISSAAILASVIIGFMIVGTPGEQRMRRFDEQRVNHLNSIQSEITRYYEDKGEAPGDLSDLNDSLYGFEVPVDPATDESYGYNPVSDEIFELCATFETKSETRGKKRAPNFKGYGGVETNFEHDAGTQCFRRTIDPDRLEAKPIPERF